MRIGEGVSRWSHKPQSQVQILDSQLSDAQVQPLPLPPNNKNYGEEAKEKTWSSPFSSLSFLSSPGWYRALHLIMKFKITDVTDFEKKNSLLGLNEEPLKIVTAVITVTTGFWIFAKTNHHVHQYLTKYGYVWHHFPSGKRVYEPLMEGNLQDALDDFYMAQKIEEQFDDS